MKVMQFAGLYVGAFSERTASANCVMRIFRSALLIAVACLLSSAAHALQAVPALTVRDAGVYLYSKQDIESPRIATLQRGDALTPIAEAVGPETWYMVRTQQGAVGWVRADDVAATDSLRETFREQQSSASTWTATDSAGRTFSGTWSAEMNSSASAASGAWTLEDGSGKTLLRGTWSAEKFSTGWNGAWRAGVEGRQNDYAGTWSADLAGSKNARLADLFQTAAANSVRGIWSAGNASGTWLIRAAK
jgi:Bacterial SH3 domain